MIHQLLQKTKSSPLVSELIFFTWVEKSMYTTILNYKYVALANRIVTIVSSKHASIYRQEFIISFAFIITLCCKLWLGTSDRPLSCHCMHLRQIIVPLLKSHSICKG